MEIPVPVKAIRRVWLIWTIAVIIGATAYLGYNHEPSRNISILFGVVAIVLLVYALHKTRTTITSMRY
jgi:quinol-cytochrome oxidoreductase complex cytochrome b subunit